METIRVYQLYSISLKIKGNDREAWYISLYISNITQLLEVMQALKERVSVSVYQLAAVRRGELAALDVCCSCELAGESCKALHLTRSHGPYSLSHAILKTVMLHNTLPQHQAQFWCDFDRASSLICGNKMSTRCNRGFYCTSYCLLNMFRAPLCPSSGAQEYYTAVAACGTSCCGFQVAGLVWS